jgi:RNA polymerase sigma factor (sigma-70 family)
VGGLLGEWQRAELRISRGLAECRGLTAEQLEDIYQDTAIALLARPYASEEHLRNALRHGIKHRALNMHRDTRRRSQILNEHAPSIQRVAESRESQAGPEEAALADQDRLIVREFLTELDELEQRVFWLIADGMRYRAIASTLQIPVNEARNASRSCERKRERFQLLYDTGRLCGYRAATIQALQAGEQTSVELARRAFAHLEACASCRAEHKTNAARLGRSFQNRLAALLPLPAFLGPTAWLRLHCPRQAMHLGATLRERITAMAGAGAGAKLATSVATVAVIAGGTIGATHAVEKHPRSRPRPTALTVTHPLVAPPIALHLGSVARRRPGRRSRQRSHNYPYVAAPRTQPATGSAPAVSESAEREFSLEASRSGSWARARSDGSHTHRAIQGRDFTAVPAR